MNPRRTESQVRAYYERGDGFARAGQEARQLLADGVPEDEILESIGFPPTNRRALDAAHQVGTPAAHDEHERAA